MENKPKYEKSFERDISLANMQIWYDTQTTIPRPWTGKTQKYLPYYVAEYDGKTINFYMDKNGIEWDKQQIFDVLEKNKNFPSEVGNEYASFMEKLRSLVKDKDSLTLEEIKEVLSVGRNAWIPFNAVWWIHEEQEKIKNMDIDVSRIIEVREKYQDMDLLDNLILKSLLMIFPNLKSLSKYILADEFWNDNIPDIGELEKRSNGYFYVKNKLFVGSTKEEIERLFNLEIERLDDVKIEASGLKGSIAYKGLVNGVVRVLKNKEDISKVQDEEILVTAMTTPDFLPAMQKAIAFITDEGGITCHAAIIARELKKPCIVGTKNATQILRDGDIVEVDAERGIVRKIS